MARPHTSLRLPQWAGRLSDRAPRPNRLPLACTPATAALKITRRSTRSQGPILTLLLFARACIAQLDTAWHL